MHAASAARSIATHVVHEARRCADPVRSAEVLPAPAYLDDDFFSFEQEAIFKREWLYLGHISQVAEPGQVLPVSVLGEPLLLVRDLSGEIRVLSAICQHRGHPLLAGLSDPGSECRIKRKSLVCSYHAWTYSLDGRLSGAPYMNETTPVSELRETIALPQLRFEVVHGFVFINFSADAPDLKSTLSKLDELFDQYRAAELVASPSLRRQGLKFNWKGYFENSLEPYHTDFVHADTHQAAPARLSGFYDYTVGDGQILTYTGFAGDQNDLLGAREATENVAALTEMPGLDSEARSRLLFVAIPPTFFAVISPTSVLVEAVTPVRAGSTDIESTIFYPKTTTDRADFDEIHAAEMAGLRSIQRQDEITQSAVQRSLGSRFVPRGTLSWLEATLPQFYSWVLERYRAELSRTTDPASSIGANQ